MKIDIHISINRLEFLIENYQFVYKLSLLGIIILFLNLIIPLDLITIIGITILIAFFLIFYTLYRVEKKTLLKLIKKTMELTVEIDNGKVLSELSDEEIIAQVEEREIDFDELHYDIEDFVEKLSNDEIIKEVKEREIDLDELHYDVGITEDDIDNGIVQKPLNELNVKERLCDLIGVNYHTNNEDIIILLKPLL